MGLALDVADTFYTTAILGQVLPSDLWSRDGGPSMGLHVYRECHQIFTSPLAFPLLPFGLSLGHSCLYNGF